MKLSGVAPIARVDPSVDWAQRYEDLRRSAWEEAPHPSGCSGLALFLRQGLVAWICAWPAEATPKAKEARHPAATDPTPLLQDLRGPLVGLLAEMILQHRPEVLP